jgi:hypothetical protein
MTEQEAQILETADALKIIINTEGWKYIQQYIYIRTKALKNELANIDLSEKAFAASKVQGEIKGLNRIVDKINEVLMKAERIKKEKNK